VQPGMACRAVYPTAVEQRLCLVDFFVGDSFRGIQEGGAF